MNSSYDTCIVGSGPAGVSAALALVAKGRSVLMVDVGKQAPREVLDLKARLFATPYRNWTQQDVDLVKANVTSTSKGVSVKRHFGSTFPYEYPEGFSQLEFHEAEVLPSFARGGLSTVWGTSALPYRHQDLIDWPIKAEVLAGHYEAVLKSARLMGTSDRLGSEFKEFTPQLQESQTSSQADHLYQKWTRNEKKLRSSGLRFGRARLLLNRYSVSEEGCVRCGLCLYGCAKNVLFNADSVLEQLKLNPCFKYLGNSQALKFEEKSGFVTLEVRDLTSNQNFEIRAKRLFIGAGVFPSAELVLKSLQLLDTRLTFLDSQYFLQPVVLPGFFKNVLKERLMTTAQLYLELENALLDKNNIHLQVYTYSPMMQDALQSKLPFKISLIPKAILGRLLGTLAVIQGYLHSDSSNKMTLEYVQNKNRWKISALSSETVSMSVKKVTAYLRSNSGKLGFWPIPGSLEVALPGRGFHSGGTFPMSLSPKSNATDIWGRPYGLKLVHLIDSSVFPTIPAATITLTVMANAHRIADQNYEQ